MPTSPWLRRTLLPLLLLVVAAHAADPPWIARSPQGMVASDSPEASRAGAGILAAGGNAFDAAIATSLALAVGRPESTGLGGGGFLVAYLAADRRVVALDFREMAPAGASAERYATRIAAAGDGPPPTLYGSYAIGVPGQVAGLGEIHRRWGSKPWGQLVEPAVQLCRDGFVADEHYLDACREALADFERWPVLKTRCRVLYETLLGRGTPPAAGTRVTRPQLARALELLAADGPEALYRGPLAEAIARTIADDDGLITLDDLAAYRVKERSPIHGTWLGCEVYSMPPPSSGGVCLLEILSLESVEARKAQAAKNPHHRHIEMLKHAFADRARWLGDPDFGDVPAARLTSPAYTAALWERIQDDRTLPAEQYGMAEPPRDAGTSHFCVVDRAGNVVAQTETINGTFGSYVVAEPFGIILNNQMDDFATEPGKPNLFGLIQGAANAVAPGKRPLSSMAPTIVIRDGRPVLALGASGGPRIITSVLQVLESVLADGQPLEAAMTALRPHHQWMPNKVYFDRAPPADLVAELKACGHEISDRCESGVVQAIQVLDDGTRVGASDPRKGGRPAGVP